jgi:hypothetical protein
MQIQKLKSSKLHYNKWPYKIACSIQGANRLTFLGIDEVRQFCSGKRTDAMPFWMRASKLSKEDKNELLQFTNNIEPYLNLKKTGQGQIRAEGRHFNIFCKDPVLLETIHAAVEPWVIGVYGPTSKEELDFMLDNGHKKILRDVLPKDEFRYKVYFKYTWAHESRQDFLKWADKFPEKISIRDGSRKWMNNKNDWANNPFMYVKDDKTLSMIGLMISGQVKKVEEFILRENLVVA